jgi:hypothetical protein
MRPSTKLRSVLFTAAVAGAVVVSAQGAGAASYDWRDVHHPEVYVNLAGVAATSGRDAWAVGTRLTAESTQVGYAEHWNGRRWTEVRLPGKDYHTFTGVSATSKRNVWVLADTHGQGQLFKHWNGRTWAEVPPATLPGHPGATVLEDVSATSASDAWAVGFHTADYPYDTVVQRWDGAHWSRVATPGSHIALRAVSALAPDDVWAVGWLTQDDVEVLATMHWNGHGWKTTTTKIPGRNAQLTDVAAVSGSEVWAAGKVDGRPAAMRWDGTRWTVLPIVELDATDINAVAPDGHGGAWLAGSDHDPQQAGRTPLYLHWDGTSWTQATSQQPEGAVSALAPIGKRASGLWAVGTTSWCDCFVGQPLVQLHGRLPGLR